MKQITLPLIEDMQRPVTYLSDWHRFYALLDTGALFPVWVADETALKKLDAELLIEHVEFGGFGGKAHGKLYKLPYFQLGDLIYPNLHIILCQMDMPCQIILSATMFHNLRYEVDDENHALNITVPDGQSTVRNLVIRDKDGKLQVLCSSGE